MSPTRLREIAERLERQYRAVADCPEKDAAAFMKFIELRNAVPDAVNALLACARDAEKWIEIPRLD